MNNQEITSVLSELHKISGFRVSLLGTNFEEIAAYPEGELPFCDRVNKIESEHSKCLQCAKIACTRAFDKKDTYIYKCRYGLIEAVSPLYNFGTLTGFIRMGQIAESEEEIVSAVAQLDEILPKDNDNSEEMIPCIGHEKVHSFVNIMTICAKYLTMSNAISSSKPTIAELAKKYIGENINKRIVIGDICDALKCSKSTLFSGFKKQYGITINSYITELKLSTALRLLSEGEMTINEVACELGFSDQSYFSKVFSAKYGIPPSEYRLGAQHTEHQT